ncbi:MAG: hypothetical protein KC964_27335, partial [Candidatus Omnitrophica bacterium]|nr:hypothetical protein [Candidatus Omnitrophota bacterium]
MNWRRPLLFQLLNMKDALYGSPFATSRAYRGILKLAGSDRAAILKDQESRLHSLVAHSYRHCSYYRQTLEESGAVRGGRVHLEDFEKIP